MIVLEIIVISATLAAMALLFCNQIMVQILEHRFYRENGGDFTVDSGIDRLRVDQKIHVRGLNLTNWQRLYIFRPIFILSVGWMLGFMIWSLL
ncbi:hypothetical protein RU07_22830 [Agrobacterium tumefaciens]|uniref:Uncharacterized protein n=1 Tax=Agrobacterium tumefaciens TaxID=358 RepID=A0A0D0IY17_AGRTU|nr:hypothetical protein RU07_22830 [Agrobacterium tumefaciens]